MVSEDMPLESTPLSTLTSGRTPEAITLDSQSGSTAGIVVRSRPERWRRPTSTEGCSTKGIQSLLRRSIRETGREDLYGRREVKCR